MKDFLVLKGGRGTTPALVRACSNCCAYENVACWNLVTFDHGNGSGDAPRPDDCCPDHKTWEEDRREDEALDRFRAALGLSPLGYWPRRT